ncbi:partial CSTF domain-containing protein, putative [Plasmodium chabaudi chabaudi]|uniref:Partial CSTF domain-containing protein, putative n=1 Tax=Plasmodium chabaudi chabaudi TaxID=31271 RepID=A0A4V6M8Z7_PLACU|nr:partial CSTF domain-containing protein, putative [Plasmodium chabaudi chabaudi]VTZ67464.1 partial CSTF domain-containing protein, putative [Plasmodium chabaudi chabaudi]|eukprot:XP_016655195.1 conserved Plasmodium protein, unknown function [Plasmodium chabaudi chabaudi]
MVDNQDINIFFASNLPYEATENSLKEYFSPHLDLAFTNLKRTKYGVKSSYGYLHFRNKKEDVISFIENNVYQNHKIWIEIFQGGVCEQEDVGKDEENSEDEKSQEIGKNEQGQVNDKNDIANSEILRNIQFDKKKMEIINKNGDITKYGQSIIENMNMHDIILIINRLQELIRASPQTAIQMLNENKKIYYSFVHALFLLGILNIDANKLNEEELILSNFHKIKSRLQYLFLNKKESDETDDTLDEDLISENKIDENSTTQNTLYNLANKKRNDNYKEQNEYGLYSSDKKKLKTKANELNNIEYENYYNEKTDSIPNSYGNVLYSFISSKGSKQNGNENKTQYNQSDINKSGLYGKGLYSLSNKNKKGKDIYNDVNNNLNPNAYVIEPDQEMNVKNTFENKKMKNNLNIDQTNYYNVEDNEKENGTSGYDEDEYNLNSNKNNPRIKGFDFGKNLIKKINTSNGQRRGIKLIDRTNNEDTAEENGIKIKNVYNIQDETNKKDKNKKNIFDNQTSLNLKKVLEKINLTISAIPEAEEKLVKEVINQKDILQNILASKYPDMLKWNNEQLLRVLSLRKSLKKKGYTIHGPI